MNNQELINPLGEVEIIALDENGHEIDRIFNNNLVVLNGRQRLAKLLSGDSDVVIDYFRIGTGTTAPVSSNTALQTPVNISSGVTQKAIDGFDFPATNKVRFNMSLTSAQGNGNEITEYGLYLEDDVLFARVVLPPFNKTSAASLNIRWTITF